MDELGSVTALRDFLDRAGLGPIDDKAGLLELLRTAWPYFSGGDLEGMRIWKLARLEKPRWEPPRLVFAMERHGGTVLGSTRATRQVWTVDLDALTAEPEVRGYRQVLPRAPALKMEPIVTELVALVTAGSRDERLRWSADRASVRIILSTCIPGGGFKETVAGRRRRLREKLGPAMTAAGWKPTDARWTYARDRPGN